MILKFFYASWQCDVFVFVSCAQTALFDSKEFLAPVITPFEAMVALSRYFRLHVLLFTLFRLTRSMWLFDNLFCASTVSISNLVGQIHVFFIVLPFITCYITKLVMEHFSCSQCQWEGNLKD